MSQEFQLPDGPFTVDYYAFGDLWEVTGPGFYKSCTYRSDAYKLCSEMNAVWLMGYTEGLLN